MTAQWILKMCIYFVLLKWAQQVVIASRMKIRMIHDSTKKLNQSIVQALDDLILHCQVELVIQQSVLEFINIQLQNLQVDFFLHCFFLENKKFEKKMSKHNLFPDSKMVTDSSLPSCTKLYLQGYCYQICHHCVHCYYYLPFLRRIFCFVLRFIFLPSLVMVCTWEAIELLVIMKSC